MKFWQRFGVCTMLAAGCSEGSNGGRDDADDVGAETTGGGDDDVATTIPVTTEATTTVDPPDDTSGKGDSSTGADDTADDTSSTGGGSDTTSSTTDDTTDDTTSSTTGDGSYVVTWCRLQYPPTIPVPMSEDPVFPGDITTVYARFYAQGLTDQTVFNDPSDVVVAQVGYGPDDSDPVDNAEWTWVEATPNPGWDGSMAIDGMFQENNDEYQGDLSFAEAGDFDFAARFSADSGQTFEYCDLDDSQTGGFTPEQAGQAEITPPT